MTVSSDPQISGLTQRIDALQRELDTRAPATRGWWTILSTVVALVASGLSALFSFSATFQTRVHDAQREFSQLLVTMNELNRRNIELMKETRFAVGERSILSGMLNAENQIYIARALRLYRTLTSPTTELLLGRQISSVDAYNLSVNFENSGLMDNALELAHAAKHFASNYSEHVAAHRRLASLLAQLPVTPDKSADHKAAWRTEIQLARDTFNAFPGATQPIVAFTHSLTEQFWADLELIGPQVDCEAARRHMLAAAKFIAEVPDQTVPMVVNQQGVIKELEARVSSRCLPR